MTYSYTKIIAFICMFAIASHTIYQIIINANGYSEFVYALVAIGLIGFLYYLVKRNESYWDSMLYYIQLSDKLQNDCWSLENKVNKIKDTGGDLARKDREIKSLREALEPFAKEAYQWEFFENTMILVELWPDLQCDSKITVGDLHQAHRVFSQDEF